MALVVWTPPSASDNSGVAPLVFSTMESPQTLGAGTVTVRAMAFDSSEQVASCTFTITVNGM
jgi:hypothetical protein